MENKYWIWLTYLACSCILSYWLGRIIRLLTDIEKNQTEESNK